MLSRWSQSELIAVLLMHLSKSLTGGWQHCLTTPSRSIVKCVMQTTVPSFTPLALSRFFKQSQPCQEKTRLYCADRATKSIAQQMDEMQTEYVGKNCMVFYICSFSSFSHLSCHKCTNIHTFLLVFFFLDVDTQIIMKQRYHITKTCKTSSSEELIFRETGTRKKVQ